MRAEDSQLKEERPDDPRYGRIVHYALLAFLTQGYEKANLESIAIAAGVGKPTVYEFFGNKAGLFDCAMKQAVEAVSRHLVSPLDPDAPVEETLCAFGEKYMTALFHPVADSPPFYYTARLVIGMSIHDPKLGRDFMNDFQALCFPPIVEYLQKLIERGAIPPVDVMEAVNFFYQIAFASYEMLFDNTVPDVDTIRRQQRIRVRRFLTALPAFDVPLER